jgi:hypothetical protein
MEQNPSVPASDAAGIDTLPPIDVPQTEWATHPLLHRARLNALGDALEWPDATFEQLPLLREIALILDDGVLYARMARQFNLDRFVDATTDESAPAQQLGAAPDRQRFYTRVTDNGFHVVGVFSAATIAGRRRYFQWLTGTWVEIGLSGFLYVRDDLDTHFSEVTPQQLEETQPGSTTTSMMPDEEWSIASFEHRFAAGPEPEPAQPEPVPEPQAEAVLEPEPAPESTPAPVPPPAVFTEPLPEQAPAPVLRSQPESVMVQNGIAVALATVAHRGGTDAMGAATIDHVARVAERFDAVADPIRHGVAWLHDVLEQSDLTERDLLEAGIRPEVVEVVSLLTRRDGVDDGLWLAGIAANEIARSVKLASLEDNAAPWRTRRLDAATRDALNARHAVVRAALAQPSEG